MLGAGKSGGILGKMVGQGGVAELVVMVMVMEMEMEMVKVGLSAHQLIMSWGWFCLAQAIGLDQRHSDRHKIMGQTRLQLLF